MTGILNLTLTAVIPSLRYFTAQEWLDYYDLKTKDVDDENGIDLIQLTRIGQAVEEGIDEETNSKFDNNSGSFYSPTTFLRESPEYHDVKFNNQNDFYTNYKPINSVTTFEKNNNAQGASPDWETLTAANNQIAIDPWTGRIRIIDSGEQPTVGTRHVRITYTFGRSTTPQDIKMLSIIETGVKIMGMAFIARKIDKLSDVEIGDLTNFMNFRNKIIKKYKNHAIITT